MLNDLAKLDPIVLLMNASARVCYAHANKTEVDTNADGTPDKQACAAKFNDFSANTGTYGADTTMVVTEFANGIIREACGPTLDATGMGTTIPLVVAPAAGLGKASPYQENRCLYVTAAAFQANTYSGQCLLIPNEGAKTMQLVAIEDKGNGEDGETKSWTATAE